MRAFLHVILITLFIISMQGCSSTEKTEEEFLLETPHIETSGSQSNGLSEIVVHGKAGSVVYVNGNKVGTIGSEGSTTIALETPQDDESTLQTLVLKDEAGNESEPVVFTLSTPPVQNSETNASEEVNEQDDNSSIDDDNSTKGTDDNISVDDDKNSSAITPPVITPTPTVATLKSLKLTADETTLNKDTNTTVNAIATFSDNTTRDVTENIRWKITPNDALNIKNKNLKTLQDGNVTLQAELNTTVSNILHVNVFWETNGHRLPPEPDSKINNATLLGIDVNNNDVRDDVERKIYATYNKEVARQLLMQSARQQQSRLADPELVKNALQWEKFDKLEIGCARYFYNKYNINLYKNFEFINEVSFNTKDRVRKYLKYNQALSGGVYGTENHYEVESSCDFNVTKALRADQ